jgi:hypothetical protein
MRLFPSTARALHLVQLFIWEYYWQSRSHMTIHFVIASVLRSVFQKTRIHWILIRVQAYCWTRIRKQAVAESGSNPDSDPNPGQGLWQNFF